MFVCFLVIAGSGIMFLFFPTGPRARYYNLGIWNRGEVREIHTIFGILMIIFAIIHFVLHWKWIIATTKNFFQKKDDNT